jgi:hypothetical protein
VLQEWPIKLIIVWGKGREFADGTSNTEGDEFGF